MGNSLQDQLLKAGIVKKAALNSSNKAKHKKAKQQGNKKTPAVSGATSQAQTEKVKRDRELNRQRMELAERKAITAQIRQLIELNRQPKDNGEVAFSFQDQKKVKRLFVSEETRGHLARGLLSIVKLDDQYEIVPRRIAEKIQSRDESCIVLSHETKESSDKDDPYSDFQIPDDLMW